MLGSEAHPAPRMHARGFNGNSKATDNALGTSQVLLISFSGRRQAPIEAKNSLTLITHYLIILR